jgi:hypothetical protein
MSLTLSAMMCQIMYILLAKDQLLLIAYLSYWGSVIVMKSYRACEDDLSY